MKTLEAVPVGSKKKSPIARLPRGIGITKTVSGRGREFWRVRLGKTFTGGTVIKKDFTNLAQAKEWIFGDAQKQKASPGSILELKQQSGASAFAISPARLAEAADAFRRCDEAGLSLSEAVDFAVRHAKPASGEISFEKAIEMALAEKKRLKKRPSYLADLGKRWRRFERWLPSDKRKAMNAVTKLDFKRFLQNCNLNPIGERNMLRNLSPLFTWAVENGHMAENPCEGIKVSGNSDESTVYILTPAQVTKLLTAASQQIKIRPKPSEDEITVLPGELLSWLTVGLFCGLRPDEAKRLEWNDIDFEKRHIDLPAAKAKGRSRRIIPMPDNLIEWLLPQRKSDGAIVPFNFRRKFWALTNAAEMRPWPKDCLRHSFGSYHLAKYSNAGLTAELMGHRSTQMLYAHYREVIKNQSDVNAYWQLSPSVFAESETKARRVVPMNRAA